jgi:hypothetical protein
MRTTATLISLAVAGSLGLAAVPSASAETMTGYSSCAKLRAEYSGGIARTAKAKKKIVRKGYRSPIVCPRVYKQVQQTLDPNRNGVACERR